MSHLDLPLIMINRIAVLTPGSMLPPYPLQPTVSVRQRGPSRSNISCVWPASWLLIGCWKSFPRSPSRGITPKHRHFWRRGRISRHAGHHHENGHRPPVRTQGPGRTRHRFADSGWRNGSRLCQWVVCCDRRPALGFDRQFHSITTPSLQWPQECYARHGQRIVVMSRACENGVTWTRVAWRVYRAGQDA